MFTAAFIAVVGAVFTASSYVSSAVNTANISYDKQVVGESLQQMQQTQQLLQEKALAETDPVKRQQKLAVAKQLGQTQQQLSSYQDTLITNASKREALALGKGVLTGSLDNVVGIADAAIDQVVAVKGAHKSQVDDVAVWSKIAGSDNGLDVELTKIKTRQALSELDLINQDLATMLKDYSQQEKEQKISSDDFERRVGELIEQQPDLQSQVLAKLDVDLGNDTNNDSYSQVVSTRSDAQNTVNENEFWLGDWKVYETSYSGKDFDEKIADNLYRFNPDGTFEFIDTIMIERTTVLKYRFDGNKGELYEFVRIDSPIGGAIEEGWNKNARERFTKRKLIYDPETQILRYEFGGESDPNNYLLLYKL